MNLLGLKGLVIFTLGIALTGGLMTVFVTVVVIRIVRRINCRVSEGFAFGLPYVSALILCAVGFLYGVYEAYLVRDVEGFPVAFLYGAFGLAGLVVGSLTAALIFSSRSVKKLTAQ